MHFLRYLKEIVTEDETKAIAKICCIQYRNSSKLKLSVGAPSSPLLSNTILYEFDCIVDKWASENQISYSRYADDLTFSTSKRGASSLVEPFITETLEKLPYLKLTLNKKKTIHLSKRKQRRVTGVVIDNAGKLSIGREKKRLLRALIHKYHLGELSLADVQNLRGQLGFAADVDPSFLSNMKKKYGNTLIKNIIANRLTS